MNRYHQNTPKSSLIWTHLWLSISFWYFPAQCFLQLGTPRNSPFLVDLFFSTNKIQHKNNKAKIEKSLETKNVSFNWWDIQHLFNPKDLKWKIWPHGIRGRKEGCDENICMWRHWRLQIWCKSFEFAAILCKWLTLHWWVQ